MDNDTHNSKQEQLKQEEELNNEKEKLRQQFQDLCEKIMNHRTSIHNNEGLCANVLNFLDANIQCIMEDLQSWSEDDKNSWLIVLNGEGSCEQGQTYYTEALDLVKSTDNWLKKFPQIMKSNQEEKKQQIEDQEQEQDYENEDELEMKEKKDDQQIISKTDELLDKYLHNNYDNESEFYAIKANMIKNKLQGIQGNYPSESNNNINNNNSSLTQASTNASENLSLENSQMQQQQQQQQQFEVNEIKVQSQFKTLEDEEQALLLQKKVILQQLQQIIIQLCQHGNNHTNCDAQQLVNQVKCIVQDVEFWSDMDRQGWLSTLNCFQSIKCDFGQKMLKQAKDVINSTKCWQYIYPNFTDAEKGAMHKLEEEMKELNHEIKFLKNQQENEKIQAEKKENQDAFEDMYSDINQMQKDILVALEKIQDRKL